MNTREILLIVKCNYVRGFGFETLNYIIYFLLYLFLTPFNNKNKLKNHKKCEATKF